MDRSSIYYQQVQLLIEVLPFISRYDCFALKGGTAINLFVRDLPRLSVDIDLVFLPDLERRAALQMIMSSFGNDRIQTHERLNKHHSRQVILKLTQMH